MTHAMHIRSTPRPRSAGFTLIEILVATVVVGIAMTSITWAVSSSTRTKAIYAEEGDRVQAALIAREIRELAETLSRTPSGVVGARSAGAVAALDSLVGAEFSPPIRADRTVETALSRWAQRVSIEVYDIDNLHTKTADSPTVAYAKTDGKLFKLHVTALHDGAEVETFSWWLTP